MECTPHARTCSARRGGNDMRSSQELTTGHRMPLEISRATRSALAVLGASFLVMAPPEKTVDTMTLSDRGIITQPSQHSVDQTVEKLRTLLQAKAAPRFGWSDLTGRTRRSGLKCLPTNLVSS